jgi:GTP-binding protein
MLATIAIIGRPNVGKSTLFNRLLRRNKALTHDMPGVTRDRIHGVVRPQSGRPFTLVDTGGLVPESNVDIERAIEEQAAEALAEAQAVLLVVDAREGLTPVDAQVARELRQSGRPVLLVANKVDGGEQESVAAEFHALGLEMLCVSAEHGHGVPALVERLERFLDEHGIDSAEPQMDPEARGLRIAMLGRPNAGKSSIINAILGERRLIVSDEAGTTRDSVDVTFERGGRTYTFVDTAGVRRRTRIEDALERFSVLRSLKSSAKAQVAVLVVDGMQAMSHQDKRLIEFLDREKTPFIVAVNKTDLLPKDTMTALREHYAKELAMVGHVPIVYTSALTRAGLGGLLPLAEKIWAECSLRVGTGELNRIMQEAIERHQPPLIKRRRAKFYYLTQAATLPPTFVFFVNDPELVKESYQRYLEKQLRKFVGLSMAPMAVHFRASHEKKTTTTKPRRPAPEPRRAPKPRQKSTKLGPAPEGGAAPAAKGAPAPATKGKPGADAPRPRPAKPKGRTPAKGIARKPGGGKSGARKAGAGKGGAKGGGKGGRG